MTEKYCDLAYVLHLIDRGDREDISVSINCLTWQGSFSAICPEVKPLAHPLLQIWRRDLNFPVDIAEMLLL